MSPLFEVLRRWPEGFHTPLAPGPWVDDAVKHGVATWVAESLALGGQRVPSALSDAARAQLAIGRKHRQFTLEVLDALRACGVVPTLLKGFGLAQRLYASPLSRPATDVDVFVAMTELPAAERALASLGLTFQNDAGMADAFEDHHHRAWSSGRGLVEVHHRLASGFGGEGFDDAAMQARAISAELDGRPVKYLSIEDEFAYLAAHASTHAFLRLSWLVDLKRFITVSPTLDWDLVARRANEVQLLRPVRVALLTAERLVGAQLSSAALTALGATSMRAPLDQFVFSESRVASASWAQQQVPAFLLHLYLTQTPRQMARHVFAGAKRALRRARSRP